MDKPDEHKGSGPCQSCAGRAYGGNLEVMRAGAAVIRKLGYGRCSQAPLFAEKLGGDDEIAELL